MNADEISLNDVPSDQRHIVENMYPLFIHDQWAYSPSLPNNFGIIESAFNKAGQASRSLKEQSEEIAPYWTESPNHHPLLIRVNDLPAGFCLLKSSPLAPDNKDYFIDGFFLLHPYRRKGIGTRAVRLLASDKPGQWAVEMKASNLPAHAFWSQVTSSISSNQIQETQFQNEFGPAIQVDFVVSLDPPRGLS